MQPLSSVLAPPTWREWLAVGLISFTALTIITWPLVPRVTSVARLDSGDGRFSVWNIGWIGHALLTQPAHLLDANIFSPHTGTLAYSELNLVAGVLGLPVFALTKNAIAAHNSAIVIGLMLSSVLTWVLVRRFTGSSGAGLVSGLLFAFCGYMQGHTAHIQLLMTFVVPLVMLCFHRLRDRPTLWRSVALGAALAVAGLSCGYYGIYGGIFMGFAALVFARRDRAYWVALACAALVAVALIGPVLVPYMRARAATGTAPVRTAGEAQAFAADLKDYASSSTLLEKWLVYEHWPAAGDELLFPGFIALAFVAMAWIPATRGPGVNVPGALSSTRLRWGYLAITLLAVWASFGPKYGLYAVLMKVVPGMTYLRAPSRLGVDTAFGLSVLAGFGVAGLVKRRRWMLPVLVVLCVVDRYAGWADLNAEPIPRVYRVLATLPPGVVVDYPFPYDAGDLHHHTRPMYYSTADWMPRVNGYSDIIPADFAQIMLPINDFPLLTSFPLLHKYNVRYVVWRLEEYKKDPNVFRTLADRFPPASPYLRPIVRDDDFWLYEIVAWPPEAGR